jgi:uncharacterized Zn-binding protein involved in type VI secretion
MPAVARETDRTTCPAHAKGKIIEGEGTVLACFQPVARMGDKVLCKDGSIDVIVGGDATVKIGGKPVARKGDKTAHGGVIVTGCPRVIIGMGLKNICKKTATGLGAGFIRYTPKGKNPFIELDPK